LAEAETMIGEMAGRQSLDGYRGGPGMQVGELANIIVAVSALLLEHQEIAGLDITRRWPTPAPAFRSRWMRCSSCDLAPGTNGTTLISQRRCPAPGR